MFENLSDRQRKIICIPLFAYVIGMTAYLIASDFVGLQMGMVESYLEQVEVGN